MKKLVSLLICLLGFLSIINVKADDNIDIDVVLDKYLHSVYYENVLEDGDNTLTISKDDVNHKINVVFTTQDKEYEISYNYTDEYIESDNRSVSVTREDLKKNLVSYLILGGLSNSIINAAGYEEYNLSEAYSYNNYDIYGLLAEEEEIVFDANEEENLPSASGNYIRYYKMSLEKSKVDKLIEDYGKIHGVSVKTFKNSSAVLSFSEITSNSVKINEAPLCYVYRSNTIDGEYTPVTKSLINGVETYTKLLVKCDGTNTIVDDNLMPNTTYYYKVEVLASSKTNPVSTILTKEENQGSTNVTPEDDNNPTDPGNNNTSNPDDNNNDNSSGNNETNNNESSTNDPETNNNSQDNNTENVPREDNTNSGNEGQENNTNVDPTDETNNDNVEKETDNSKKDNPSTGLSDYYIPLSISIIILGGAVYYLNKKNIINLKEL